MGLMVYVEANISAFLPASSHQHRNQQTNLSSIAFTESHVETSKFGRRCYADVSKSNLYAGIYATITCEMLAGLVP